MRNKIKTATVENSESADATKFEKLRLTGFIVLAGFVFAVLFHYALFVYFHKPLYPYGTYMFNPGDALNDFRGLWFMNEHVDPFRTTFRGFGNNYPPFGYGIILPFTLFPRETGVILYFSFLVVGFLWFFWKQYRIPNSKNAAMPFILLSLGLLTYPFQFVLDRLNSEGIIVLAAAAFFSFYRKGRHGLAPMFLGMSAAAKAYPGLYAVVYLGEKKFRKFFECIGWTIAFTALAMLVFRVTPAEVQEAYARSFEGFKGFSLSTSNAQHGVNLLGAWKYIQVLIWGPEVAYAPNVAANTIANYFYVAVPLLGIYLLSAIAPGLAVWQRFALVVSAILLIPQTSFDYKLAHLFLPFAAFVNADTNERDTRYYSIVFGLLLIPKHYFLILEDISAAVVLNPLLLLMLSLPLVRKAYRGFSERGFSGKTAPQ